MSAPDPPGWQPPPPPPPPGGGGWQPPPQPPQGGGWPPQPQFQPPGPTSGNATAALVLGICGIVVCPLILSIPALVLGYKARREIDESNGVIQGRGSAVAGIVLGWIGLVFGLLLIGGLIAFGIWGESTDYYDYDTTTALLR